jgi:predicted nucleic acid-binding protein
MPLVLDASVAASWAFPDETDARAGIAFERIRTEHALVPAIWWFEIRNTLVVNERRKRIAEAQTKSFLRNLHLHPIHTDRQPDEAAVLRIARTYRLSVYDAAYLELAQREGLPLATLDSALSRAARAESVRLIGEK